MVEVEIVDYPRDALKTGDGHPDPVGALGEPGVEGLHDRDELVLRLREVADRTPPVCHYQTPEEVDCFGKKITVYCKPFEQFQYLLRLAASVIAASSWDALPCKIGDTAWGVRNYKGVNHPQSGEISEMYYSEDMRLIVKIKHICVGEWGKKVFSTREAAEEAIRRADDATD